MSEWIIKESSKRPGVPYYFNIKTGEALWEKPAAFVEPAAMSSGPASVRASHILVKHAGSRRPASWRCESITLTKAEAIAKLEKIRAAVVADGSQFEAIAAVESDCSSAKNGGDLGPFKRGAMQKPFEDASFALDVGQLSGIVDTDSGVHIVRCPPRPAATSTGKPLTPLPLFAPPPADQEDCVNVRLSPFLLSSLWCCT